jgi:hypothetical protein
MGRVSPASTEGSLYRTRETATMTKKTEEGVPALQNDDVTGMTEEKQEEIIERSGRAPRKDAAEEFYQEQGEQARTTPTPGQGTGR